jgi:hypothetical protein
VTPLGSGRAHDPVPVVLQYCVTGWAVGRDVRGLLVEAGADGKLPECKLDHKLMFRDGQAADGREGCASVYLLEGFVGPVLLSKKVSAESRSAGCVKKGFTDLTHNTFATDSDVGVAIRVMEHCGVELTDAELVADNIELCWPREHF